ncbi:MAG TPA: glycerophosphodiester phosphodiesterase family protein, partial [Chitinophagales bacterium]
DYNIFNMTVAEVQSYDCGSKYYPAFPQQQKIKVSKPLLSEVIDSVRIYCSRNGIKMPKLNIEIKCWKSKDEVFQPDPKTFVQLLYSVLKEKEFLNNVIVQSFDLRVLQELYAVDKNVPQELLIANLKSVKQNVKALGHTPASYAPYYKLVSKKTVETCHELGMIIVPWTVNSVDEMQKLKNLGVDGLITDYPNIAVTIKK